ncbi:MAG: PAS domain S-box protein [Candidatus Pristimantibacillus sp.]
MSFKIKFSLLISLIVLTMFILTVILDEYSMLRNMNRDNEVFLNKISLQLATVVADIPTELEERMLIYNNPNSEIHQMLPLIQKIDPDLLEIAVYNQNTELMYGTNYYSDKVKDSSFIKKVYQSGFEVRKVELNGKTYMKSYYSNEQLAPRVIGMVYNLDEVKNLLSVKRYEALKYGAWIILFVLITSYLLSGFLLKPLRSILWKVNEVSLGRFDSVIQVKGKDEFGLLALKINAMSQNLSIYMDKLRKAFEENRRMKEYLQSFINHTSDAIHVIDLKGTIIQVNQAFEQLFGYTSEEALGYDLPLIPESHRGEMRLIISSLLAGKVLPAQETTRVTKSGEVIPVSVTISPIRDLDGNIQALASITRDMRSRNKMEELLHRSEKLTTVGQLAAGVAHEIRNPLTTLRGFLQLQQQSQKMNLQHTSLMLSELDRINLIVGEFLILAKPQAARFATKDVRSVFKDVLSLLDSEAHLYNVVFSTSFTDLPCLVSCEENQLKQVFINLLKNGIEAMPSGGRIHTHIAYKQKQITISISDEGVGIPEEMIPKIGNPFFTGKESGTGLGMMISQRIIHSHQGLMEIQSQVNVGTTVTIILPALNAMVPEGILNEGDTNRVEGI